MKFYIVTPTYNALKWLPRCVRSVADQVGEGVEIHHHVQDGGSTDGAAEWLIPWQTAHEGVAGYTFTYASEKDAGMYDAINRAWDLLPDDADVTAHLNSDEQYLPGALAEIADWMHRKPAAEVLLGTYIIVDAENQYICHRRPVIPRSWSSWLNCACITNSSFYRCDSFRRLAPRFDARWRCVSDLVFFRELTWKQVRFCTVPVITSLFVCTGSNLAWTGLAQDEWKSLHAEVPLPVRLFHGIISRWVNFKRRIVNLFCEPPRRYVAYDADVPEPREYPIDRPTVIWRKQTRV